MSLFCGYVSSLASELFVKRIFKNIKVDSPLCCKPVLNRLTSLIKGRESAQHC